MNFAFTEQQGELARNARRFLQKHSATEAVRRAMETERGYDPALWQDIAELGWPAVIIDEAYDGIGLGYVELVALMEEMGRALVCAPFFSSVCLAANALLLAGDEAQKRRWLPGIAAGTTTGTLAVAGDIAATRSAEGYSLSGSVTGVIDGHSADVIVVSDGVELYVVPGDAPGVQRDVLPTMDQTRRRARLVFDAVAVAEDHKLAAGSGALPRILDRACIALAAEQVGGAERCLDMAVDYAKTRTQFGRPIGSFQAIKHKCADMLVQVESARSAAYWAGWCAATDDAELALAAPLAKATCSAAYFHCAAEAIQIHGGVGFTWECDAQLFFKRARASEQLFGAPAAHRDALATRLGW